MKLAVILLLLPTFVYAGKKASVDSVFCGENPSNPMISNYVVVYQKGNVLESGSEYVEFVVKEIYYKEPVAHDTYELNSVSFKKNESGKFEIEMKSSELTLSVKTQLSEMGEGDYQLKGSVAHADWEAPELNCYITVLED
ncbi:MAG: hypothetical protein HOE90_22960 [Bacteriovoracaceae bacterium]|jgi:hypothetical protein|nr:hypothetical protein [Bacteriovoracaceae bacterium]